MRRASLGRTAALAATLALIGGCALVELRKVRETDAAHAQYAYVSGTVTWDVPDAHWVVVYIENVPCDEDWDALQDLVARDALPQDPTLWSPDVAALANRLVAKRTMAEHFVRNRPGFWYAHLAPGCYGVGAFLDLDRNYRYDDEPVAKIHRDRLFRVAAGDRREDIGLVIEPEARLSHGVDPLADQIRRGDGIRSHQEQRFASMGAVTIEGEIADLSDERFGRENGRLGYFQTYRFIAEVGPGIYFLEPYDARKIPVLFVHGALGFPQEFTALIEGLDRTRYQPWFAFYPSGENLDELGDYLVRTVTNLRLRHGFDRLAVVAHSMGGLVSRHFLLRQHAEVADDPVRLFVSISTPWDGVPSAQSGVDGSPYVVASWNDIRPKSPFLANLFFEDPETRQVRRRLPEPVSFHLLFGVADQTIPLASAIRWEALRDAQERWPLPYGHTEILESPEASRLLNEILARELR